MKQIPISRQKPYLSILLLFRRMETLPCLSYLHAEKMINPVKNIF